jgi:hypothetical protein
MSGKTDGKQFNEGLDVSDTSQRITILTMWLYFT